MTTDDMIKAYRSTGSFRAAARLLCVHRDRIRAAVMGASPKAKTAADVDAALGVSFQSQASA